MAAALAIEAPLFGVALLWLLALVPAAVVTAMKGHWALFLCGPISLGLTWIFGALILAPPDSAWARWRYDEETLRRASDPIRYKRPRHRVALWAGAVIALALFLGLFAARPAPILGLDGEPLQSSVGGSSVRSSCESVRSGVWICGRYDDQSSGSVDYRVSVNQRGCWQAVRVSGGSGERSRKRISGCVTILDYFL